MEDLLEKLIADLSSAPEVVVLSAELGTPAAARAARRLVRRGPVALRALRHAGQRAAAALR